VSGSSGRGAFNGLTGGRSSSLPHRSAVCRPLGKQRVSGAALGHSRGARRRAYGLGRLFHRQPDHDPQVQDLALFVRHGGGPTSEPEHTISSVRAGHQGYVGGSGTALWGHQSFRTRYLTRSRWYSWVPTGGLIMCRNPALWRGLQNIDCGLGFGRSWRFDRVSGPLHRSCPLLVTPGHHDPGPRPPTHQANPYPTRSQAS
jgi:hypothetical protein